MAHAGFPVHVSWMTVSGRRRRIEDRPHKDPLSFCFRPHENRKRGETTKSFSLSTPSPITSLRRFGPFRCLSGTDVYGSERCPFREDWKKLLVTVEIFDTIMTGIQNIRY